MLLKVSKFQKEMGAFIFLSDHFVDARAKITELFYWFFLEGGLKATKFPLEISDLYEGHYLLVERFIVTCPKI